MNNLDYRNDSNNIKSVKNFNECKKLVINNNITGKKIGEGFEGEIYLVESEECGFIVVKTYKSSKYSNKFEINLIKKIKYIINKNICPNFIYYYDFITKNNKNYFFMELIDDNIMNILKKTYENYFYESFFFQIFCAILCMEKILKICHNDLTIFNIMYKKVNKNTTYKYIINNESYYIPTYGYLFVIGDFGQAIYINEKNKKKDFNSFIKIIGKIKNRIIKNYFRSINIVSYNDLLKLLSTDNKIIVKKYIDSLNIDIHGTQTVEEQEYNYAFNYILDNNMIDLKKNVPSDIYKDYIRLKNLLEKYLNKNIDDFFNIIKLFDKYKKKLPYIKEFTMNF